MIPVVIEERLLYLLLAPAVTEGLLVAEHHEYININRDEAEREETLDLTEHVLTRRIIQALISANVVSIKNPRPAGAPLADDRLRDPLREGFEEGRNPQPPSMAPKTSATRPETYEQLQLPGMED